MASYLVTGAAGFIGFHTAKALLAQGQEVVGIDNLNDYYPPKLKEDRLAILLKKPGFTFQKLDLADREGMSKLFQGRRLEKVIHLGAQAGVRYSLENPAAYIDSNLVGFGNVLEECRHHGVAHLVYASSSSVYGANTKMPFSVHDGTDHPVSLYAATKKANELMAHTYSHLFGLPTTGLRFFTVYGPWGRPDMALFLFTRAILAGEPIKVFNHGDMRRDFTYIDDIVNGVLKATENVPAPNPDWDRENPDPGSSYAPFKVYNIGNNHPVRLLEMIETLERLIGRTAEKEMLPMQAGDVPATYADITDLAEAVGFAPSTPLAEGMKAFVEWYLDYYKANS